MQEKEKAAASSEDCSSSPAPSPIEKELRQSYKELAAIYEAMLEGLVVADIQTKRFIKVNPAMCRLLGYDENELLSLSVRDIHPPSVQDTVMENFRLAAEGRLQIAKNILLLKKDGETAVADISISRFSFNERPCIVGLFHDITDRKKMEEDLRRSREELEFRVLQRTRELANAIRKQDEYFKQLRQMTAELTKTEQRERQQLARILHDGLQQHLAAAGYQVELIRDSEDVQKDLNKLKKVLDEASETARILAAELSPPILLRRNLFSALEWLAEWMHKKHGLEVALEGNTTGHTLPEEILILLFETTRELLFNVIKHSGIKKARVILDQQEQQILLTVKDQGKGFDPGILNMNDGRAGGYGLFQIRERLSLMGGYIEIDSRLGSGCSFHIVFPISSETSEKVQESAPGKVSAGTGTPGEIKPEEGKIKIRLMVVDDHLVVRQGVTDLLGRQPGIDIVGEASDGLEAVALAREIRPDVILMDINLPVMDGIQATRMIRSENTDVRIIGFSMYQEESQREAMIEAGATAYLTKSESSIELIETIQSCVRPA